jgi:hypothetical protein
MGVVGCLSAGERGRRSGFPFSLGRLFGHPSFPLVSSTFLPPPPFSPSLLFLFRHRSRDRDLRLLIPNLITNLTAQLPPGSSFPLWRNLALYPSTPNLYLPPTETREPLDRSSCPFANHRHSPPVRASHLSEYLQQPPTTAPIGKALGNTDKKNTDPETQLATAASLVLALASAAGPSERKLFTIYKPRPHEPTPQRTTQP